MLGFKLIQISKRGPYVSPCRAEYILVYKQIIFSIIPQHWRVQAVENLPGGKQGTAYSAQPIP